MAQIFEYQVGDRVSLALDGAFEAEQWTGITGTVERVEDRRGNVPLYHVILDRPITEPGWFFSHISEDGLRDGFAAQWLAPAEPDEEIEIGSLTDVL